MDMDPLKEFNKDRVTLVMGLLQTFILVTNKETVVLCLITLIIQLTEKSVQLVVT